MDDHDLSTKTLVPINDPSDHVIEENNYTIEHTTEGPAVISMPDLSCDPAQPKTTFPASVADIPLPGEVVDEIPLPPPTTPPPTIENKQTLTEDTQKINDKVDDETTVTLTESPTLVTSSLNDSNGSNASCNLHLHVSTEENDISMESAQSVDGDHVTGSDEIEEVPVVPIEEELVPVPVEEPVEPIVEQQEKVVEATEVITVADEQPPEITVLKMEDEEVEEIVGDYSSAPLAVKKSTTRRGGVQNKQQNSEAVFLKQSSAQNTDPKVAKKTLNDITAEAIMDEDDLADTILPHQTPNTKISPQQQPPSPPSPPPPITTVVQQQQQQLQPKKQAAIVQQQVVAARDADGKPVYYLETVDEDGVVVMQEAALLVEGEDDDDEDGEDGEVHLIGVQDDEVEEEEEEELDADYQESENIQLYITSDDISEELEPSSGNTQGRALIPSHLHGRTVNAPSRDSVKNGKSAPKPRLGVKVPYKNLTSQIVSKAEITEAIMERSLRTSALRATSMQGGVGNTRSGLDLFSKKMTKRLASKMSADDDDEEQELQHAQLPPKKKVFTAGMKGAGIAIGSRNVAGSGTEDLLAILEGNEDDKAHHPTTAIASATIIQTATPSPNRVLTAAEERAIALKQLQAIDSDSEDDEDIRNIQATLKRQQTQQAYQRRASARESRDVREAREAAATLERSNQSARRSSTNSNDSKSSAVSRPLAKPADVMEAQEGTPVKRPRGRPKKVVAAQEAVLQEEEQLIEEELAEQKVVVLEQQPPPASSSISSSARPVPGQKLLPPKNAETPAESPRTTITPSPSARANSEPEPKFASHVPLKTYARKRKPSETGAAPTGKGEYDFVDEVSSDQAGDKLPPDNTKVDKVTAEKDATPAVKATKPEDKKKDDRKSGKDKDTKRDKDHGKSTVKEPTKKHQESSNKKSSKEEETTTKSSKKLEESTTKPPKIAEDKSATKKLENTTTKAPSKKIIDEPPAKSHHKKSESESTKKASPEDSKKDDSKDKKDSIKVVEKTPTIPPTMHMTKSARVIKKKVIWDPDDTSSASPKGTPLKTFSSSASTSSTASSSGSIGDKEKEKSSTSAKFERKTNKAIDDSKPQKHQEMHKLEAKKAGEQTKKQTDEAKQLDDDQVDEEMDEPKISPTKKRKLNEVAKLLKDEGAINMLYSLKSNQTEDNDAPGGNRSTRRNKDFLGKASDLYEDLTTISSMESPKALRKKAGPIIHEKKKRSSAAPLLSRKKSGDSYRSSNHSAPASPQHVGNASFAADASRIIRRRSSSSFGSLEDAQRDDTGEDEEEEEEEAEEEEEEEEEAEEEEEEEGTEGADTEGSLTEDIEITPKNIEATPVPSITRPDKEKPPQSTTINNNNRRKQPASPAKLHSSPKRQKISTEPSLSDLDRENLKAKMSQSFNELVNKDKIDEDDEDDVRIIEEPKEEPKNEEPDDEVIDITARLKDWEGEVFMENEFVKMTQRENVFRITLLEGDKFDGRLNFEILKQLTTLLTDLETNDKCHVIVLTSTTPSLCSGLNFAALFNQNEQIALRNSTELAFIIRKFLIALVKFPKPLVAAIKGGSNCGLGCTMLPLFDVVISADTATFSAHADALTKSCSLVEGGSLLTSGNLTQHALVSELLFIGGKLSAAQALRYGLVTRLVWPRNYDAELHTTVCNITSHSLEFLKSTKKQTRQHTIATTVELIKTETDTLIKHWTSADCQQQFQQLQQQQLQTLTKQI